MITNFYDYKCRLRVRTENHETKGLTLQNVMPKPCNNDIRNPLPQFSEIRTLKSNVVDYTGNGIGKTSAPQTTLNGNEIIAKSVCGHTFQPHDVFVGLADLK